VTSGPDSSDPVALAARYGLTRTTARPSLPAYFKQLWERRHFIRAYAAARTTSTYSGSRLGQLWQVVTPLLNAGVYFVLFGVLLQLSRGVENYPAFLVTGVFVFTFTMRSMNNGAKSISGNLSLVRALHFPRAVLPLSFVLVELKQMLISVGALFVIIPLTGVLKDTDDGIMWQWFLIVPAIALHVLFNVGLGLTMARVGATSTDVNQLLPFITRLWFYTSGVFYSVDRFGSRLPDTIQPVMHPILQLNPGAIFLDLYRTVLISTHQPLDLPLGLNVWAVAGFWAVLLICGGFVFFWRREEKYGRG
jgi:teichoic acid transport system permease protein